MKQKITVFGSFVVDMMARSSHLPVPAETVKGSFFQQNPGGKGFNQAVAAHKAGGDVAMVTKVGRDSLADVMLNTMTELNMPKDYLAYSDEVATGVALILVDGNTSQNEIVIVPGSCNTINDEDIERVKPRLKESGFCLMQLEVNQDANEKVARFCKENGVKLIINTAPYSPMTDEFLNGAYLVTPNEVEAEEITGVKVIDQESASRAARVFLDKGVQNVLITMGSKGAFISSGGREAMVPPFTVKAVDTTGAGDAFSGGLLTALAEGRDIWEAARFASALAAISVTRIGAAPAMPARGEIDAFLAAHTKS